MPENEHTLNIIHEYGKTDPTKKVKLMKMSKGYQWEITYESTDNEDLLSEIAQLDAALRQAFEVRLEEDK